MDKPLLCLMGPTASGKTALAIELVRRYPFEIISVDSAMVYRGMDIGSAKPSAEELDIAPHHLIDVLDPDESFSVAMFCEQVASLSKEISARGHIPLLVGGSMMYFHALQQGMAKMPESDAILREQLNEQLLTQGVLVLHQQLEKLDPESASRIHPHDTQRILRALEVYMLSGKPMSEWWAQQKDNQVHFNNLILMPEQRSWLHQRIAERFKKMLELGFMDEVALLKARWQLDTTYPSMRSVGYRQALSYLDGLDDYDTFVEKGLAATRQLAKRQMTWLRHWSSGQVFRCDNLDLHAKVMAHVAHFIDNLQ